MVRISGLPHLMVILDEPKIECTHKANERHWLYGQFSPLLLQYLLPSHAIRRNNDPYKPYMLQPSSTKHRAYFMGFCPLACALCRLSSCFSFLFSAFAVIPVSFLNGLNMYPPTLQSRLMGIFTLPVLIRFRALIPK
jgi:hypothetical protein